MKNEIEEPTSKVLKNPNIATAEFYSQIFDSLQDYSIFTMDNELILNSWSSGSVKIFGYENKEVTGKHFEMLFTEKDRLAGVPTNEIETALKNGRAADNRWHLCKNGSEFYSFGLLFPLIGANGKKLGYVKILRDLTEKKKLEDTVDKYIKELEVLNKHKETVLTILSHDLRTPLSGIIGTTGYLASHFASMERIEIKQMLELLSKTAKEEVDLLDYLVDWARIKFGTEAFSPTQTELSMCVDKIFDLLKETAVIKTLILRNEIEERICVFADKNMLLSILQNIITNAIVYSYPGGTVTARAGKVKNKIVIVITDHGIGMSQAIKEKLFIPQIKTNALAKEREKEKDAGIGLLLVKSLVEKNAGEIWVESVEGQGSSFYFTMPREKAKTLELLKKTDFFSE